MSTVDLTQLDAANAALQASPTVAKATKDYAAAATSVLHEMNGDTPPPPPAGLWEWDALGAQLDPNSSSKVSAFQSYAVAKGCYFVAAVAWQNAPAGTPAYAIPVTSQTTSPITAPVPLGTQPGCTNDHTLSVRDSTGQDWDFGNATYNVSSRKISSTAGAAFVPPGSVGETGPGGNSANAAKFQLRAGPITPADVTNGISHALHFSCPNVGPAPNRYPALSTVGYTGNTGIPLGSWLRLDPTVNVGALGLSAFETKVAVALQRYGMFLRDIGSNIGIYGTDQVNQGGNAVDWPAVGVTLTSKTNAGILYALPFSKSFPWTRLQLLAPPAP